MTEDGCVYICDTHSCRKYIKTSDFFVNICMTKLSYKLCDNNSDGDDDDTELLLNSLSAPKSDAILGITASNTIYDLTRNYKFSYNTTLKVNH